MKNNNFYLLLGILLSLMLFSSCSKESNDLIVLSPDNKIETEFSVNKKGEPFYIVKYQGAIIIDTSFMSFDFKDLPALKDNFKINFN